MFIIHDNQPFVQLFKIHEFLAIACSKRTIISNHLLIFTLFIVNSKIKSHNLMHVRYLHVLLKMFCDN